ncbi:MAG: glycosyltransferase family 2 protein [Candidatus Bathyarchaeota archaeon]|nr:glycosyltransferase family 2 protein [Candidatus Bathyarchaeota archaeon]
MSSLPHDASNSINAGNRFDYGVNASGARKISVFIPVYRGSDLLDGLLQELTNCRYEDKEIFVAIDEPDEKSLKVVKKYEGKVSFILSGERRGKVEALNSAIKISRGEILVFLDADVQLRGGDFFESIATAMEEAEILDFKKEIIQDSFISRMVHYEFLSCNLVSYLYSKLVRKCIGINGVAFAITRKAFEEVGGFSKVISEDFDLAVKTLLKNKRFRYTEKVSVRTKAPSDWRGWFNQRKRWGVGVGLWLKDYWKKLLRYLAKYPHVIIPTFIILFPTFIPVLLNYAFTNFPPDKIPNFLPSFFVMRFNILFPLIRHVGDFLPTLLATFFASFLLFSALFCSASRKLKFHFNFAEFLIYFFFYQPMASIILFAYIITAFFSANHKLEWKV